jgi:NAD(P)H-dependent flavin oxidoreductase YrpB (nitropropane dioxygenase family)
MLSATTTRTESELEPVAGHVRAALERAGIEDIFLTKRPDGFRARGIKGRSSLAMLASYTPLAFTGIFCRSGVEVRCTRSLNDGDQNLHIAVRVRALREFDDHEEIDWITRGPGEILGDLLQNRRVLRRVMNSVTQATGAEPEDPGQAQSTSSDPAARRAQFGERYRKG